MRFSGLRSLPVVLALGLLTAACGDDTVGNPVDGSVDAATGDGGRADGAADAATGLAVTTTTLPGGQSGTPYTTTLGAGGGQTPYRWALTGGTLPPGITLASDGTVSGTPTAGGSFTFTVQVTDAAGKTATANISITITGTTGLQVITTTLLGGITGLSYSGNVMAAGGTTPYSWSITAGSLPDGLTLDPATGAITGTPTTTGSFSFTVQAADASAPQQTQTANLSIVISGPLTVTSTALPAGTTGQPFTTMLTASGGTTPYTWSVTAGALPAGLTLAADGTISGTPTVAGSFTFTVSPIDASNPQQFISATLTLVVNQALTITTTSVANGTIGVSYPGATLAATGGTSPYTWSCTGACATSLPPGLALSAAGVLSGTPTMTGVFTFTVSVQGSGPTPLTATKAFTIHINGAGVLTITTGALPSGVQGGSYATTLAASGGTTPDRWTVASGTLPPGLTLTTGGQISGTATTAGSFMFTIQVADSSTPTAQTATQSFTIDVSAKLAITTTTLPSGAVNGPYSGVVTATGGTQPYTWSVTTGTLPPGTTLNAGTGVVSGTPTMAGSFSFTIQVQDAPGTLRQTATHMFTVVVTGPLTITTTSPLASGTMGVRYSTTLMATGGTPPYTWGVATGSTLPPGLALDAATGVLSGTPTAAGSFTFTLRVTDSSGPPQSVTRQLTLTIASPLAITNPNLPNGTAGLAYSVTMAASGGNPPYTWSVAGATALPSGLTLDAQTGVISGTPSTPGTGTFMIAVTDSTGNTTMRTFSIAISPAGSLAITTTKLPGGITNTAYNQTLMASGGATPYTWTCNTPCGLPGGIQLSTGGVLMGTPGGGSAGTYTFTVTVTDSTSPTHQMASRTFTLVITRPLRITTATVANAPKGSAYNVTLTATGGSNPDNWAVSAGTLPPGLMLSSGGTLSGTPTTNGTYMFTVRVTDSSTPMQTATHDYQIVVADPLVITTTSLPAGTMGTAYSQTVMASGGVPPYTWAVPGPIPNAGLPPGLMLNMATGTISGTPLFKGTFNFTVMVTDASGQRVTHQFSITIN